MNLRCISLGPFYRRVAAPRGPVDQTPPLRPRFEGLSLDPSVHGCAPKSALYLSANLRCISLGPFYRRVAPVATQARAPRGPVDQPPLKELGVMDVLVHGSHLRS